MNDASRDREKPSDSRPATPSPVVQGVVLAITGVVVLSASAALSWTIQGWRKTSGPPLVASRDALESGAPAETEAGHGSLGAGRLAYRVHCARCHGEEGHGDGNDAERLRPPPRDFASDGWRTPPTSASIRQVIVAGIPGTAMPGLGASLSAHELNGLVAHVLSLAPPPGPIPNAGLYPADHRGAGDAPLPLPSVLAARLARAGLVAEATPRPAPPLAVRDLDGRLVTLDSYRGRPIVVLFWGTTCVPCLTEMPAALRFADLHRDSGLVVLPVCVDESDPAVVRDVVGPLSSAGRPVCLDHDGTARLRYDVQTLPALALIDRSGRLIARAQGARDWSDPARRPGPTGSDTGDTRMIPPSVREVIDVPHPDHRSR